MNDSIEDRLRATLARECCELQATVDAQVKQIHQLTLEKEALECQVDMLKADIAEIHKLSAPHAQADEF